MSTALVTRADPDVTRRIDQDAIHNLQALVAVLAAFLIGFRYTLHAGVTPGLLLSVLLTPLWIGTLRHYRGARIAVALGTATALCGYALSSWAADHGFALNSSDRVQSVTLLVAGALGVAVLVWGSRFVAFQTLGAAVGLGMIAAQLVHPDATNGNPWKFVWAVPVSVLVISLAARSRRLSVGIIAVFLLAGVSVVESCRAYSAALFLAALLLLWRARPRGDGAGHRAWVVTAGFVAALAGALYYLGSSLLVSGYLGTAAQARTIEQIDTSGSLILGGRPEISAAWALFKSRPGGYGTGVVPRLEDILTAKSGMIDIGYNPDNGYVEKYMFGGHIELHSVAGDMWASYGVFGLVCVVAILFVTVRSLSVNLARRTGDALVFYLCVWTLWNLLFSPLEASMPILVLVVAAAVRERPRAVSVSVSAS